MGDLLLSISTTLTFTLIFTSKFQVFFFHLLLSGKNFGFGILFGSDCWTQLALIIKVKLNILHDVIYIVHFLMIQQQSIFLHYLIINLQLSNPKSKVKY